MSQKITLISSPAVKKRKMAILKLLRATQQLLNKYQQLVIQGRSHAMKSPRTAHSSHMKKPLAA